MDVRCARCNTEYEFDDALVSERGTTVKCTNCGHQFKVYPGGGSGGAPERWIVRKASGRELVYTSLKDLQRAISQRQVGPSDMLSRGGGQALRRLEDIAELEPFFQSQIGTPQPVQRTLLGISPTTRPEHHEDTIPDAAPSFAETMASTPDGRLPPHAQHRAEPVTYDDQLEPKTVPRNPTPPAGQVALDTTQPANAPHPGYAPGAPEASAPAPQVRIREVPQAPNLTPTPSGVSEGYRAYEERHTDPRFVAHVPQRSSTARWIVALVVLGALGFAAATVGRKHLENLLEKPAAESPKPATEDERVTKLVEEARERFFEGDLEEAKERLDKASVLAEQNPKIYAALARLEAARADVHWLATRLDPDETERERDAQRLEARLKKVRAAVEEAKATNPKNTDVIRANIDYLRLSGKVDAARALVPSVSDSASDPETAYVLAALDLSEEKPVWPSIIERLRAAASAEGDLGRARSALIYALARSGAVDDAKKELERLGARDEPHPLHERLEAFVDQAKPDAIDGGKTQKEAEPSGEDEPAETERRSETAAAGSEPGAGDFRTLLTDASNAKSSGDLTRARALYSMALEKSPGNVEAMAGLADVARAQGDTAIATRYYDDVIAKNPAYLPALMARADMKWSAGDRAGAVAMYRRVVQQSGPGSAYSARASRRISEFEGGGSESPPAGAATPDPEPTPAPAPAPAPATDSPPADEPHIDTSDLPGFN